MERIPVMVNGLPGKMAMEVAQSIAHPLKFELLPYSLTGERKKEVYIDVANSRVQLVRPQERDSIPFKNGLFAVDYTAPDARGVNAELYCKNGLHFIMGTSGADSLDDIVHGSSSLAVIDTNMAPAVVLLNTAMRYLARMFEGSLQD